MFVYIFCIFAIIGAFFVILACVNALDEVTSLFTNNENFGLCILNIVWFLYAIATATAAILYCRNVCFGGY